MSVLIEERKKGRKNKMKSMGMPSKWWWISSCWLLLLLAVKALKISDDGCSSCQQGEVRIYPKISWPYSAQYRSSLKLDWSSGGEPSGGPQLPILPSMPKLGHGPFCTHCQYHSFFPLLLIFTVLLITFFNRDFGPILTAERKALPPAPLHPETQINVKSKVGGVLCPDRGKGGGEGGTETDEEAEKVELHGSDSIAGSVGSPATEEYNGPLSPKKGVKYRWFNAVIPFLITMIITLVGMILDGWQKIRSMPDDDKKLSMSVINIFTVADSVAALIWASALACAVAMAMLLLQRILTLDEYMTAWMEGVKDIIEPYMVLWLAWALGAAIQDIQTTNYLAKTLSEGGLDAKYIPAIVTIIGFAMSFAAGSAFGTMGIIFPLVIPTICKISSCNKNDVLQSSAAILASALFGNIISPIAGICILTVFASQCPLERHIKSAALYALTIAFVSVVFGTLPVGAGWYPWYEAWIVMAVIMICIMVLFSSNSDNPASLPLMQRLFPSLYSAPPRYVSMHYQRWQSSRLQARLRAAWCCCCIKKKKTLLVSSDGLNHAENFESSEKAKLLS